MLDAAFPKLEGTLRLPFFAEMMDNPAPTPANDSTESLPLFARLDDAAPG